MKSPSLTFFFIKWPIDYLTCKENIKNITIMLNITKRRTSFGLGITLNCV